MTEEFNRKTLNDKINTLMKAQKYDEALEICNTALTQKDLYDDVFSAKLYYTKGFILYKHQDYENSIDYFDEAIVLQSNEPAFYFYRGSAKVATENYWGAVNDYTQALEHMSQEPFLYKKRGYAYELLYENKKAQDDYIKAIELGMKESDLFYHLSVVEDREKLYTEAISSLTSAIELEKNSQIKSHFYYKRGEIKRAIEDLDGAAEDFKLGLDCDTNNEDCKNALEYLVYQAELEKDNLEQIQALTEKINSGNELAESYCQRADLYYDKSMYNEAINDYLKLSELVQEENLEFVKKYALNRIALSYHYMRNYNAELDAYNNIIKYYPNDIAAYEQKAELQKDYLEDFEGAINTYNAAINNCSEIKDLYYKIAYLFFKLERYDEAEKEVLNDLRINNGKECQDSYQLLGDIRYKQGLYEESIEYFNKALGKGDSVDIAEISDIYNILDFFIIAKIAKAEMQLKEYDKALTKFNELLKIGSYNKELLFERAKLYSILGRKQEALQDITRAISMDTDNKELMAFRESLINEK